MIINCENCGEPAMPTDTNCWHCGEPLAGRETNREESKTAEDSWQSSISPTVILIYGIITVVVIVAAIGLMAFLGNRPLLQIGVGTRTPDQWRAIVPADLSFYVNIPEDWRTWDGADPTEVAALEEQLTSQSVFSVATHPIGAEIDDLQITFLGIDGPTGDEIPTAFFVVGLSQRLANLSYDEAMRFFSDSEPQVLEFDFVDNFDKSHLSIMARLPVDEEQESWIRCRQQFTKAEGGGMITALCALEELYFGQEGMFVDILESFQRFPS